MHIVIQVLARFGLLLCAAVLAWLAHLLHTHAEGKGKKVKAGKKNLAVVVMILAGLALVGTVVGGWMTSNLGARGGFFSAALVLITAGPVVVFWIANGKPNRVALWLVVGAPLSIILGAAQVVALSHEVGRQGNRVGDTISSTTKR